MKNKIKFRLKKVHKAIILGLVLGVCLITIAYIYPKEDMAKSYDVLKQEQTISQKRILASNENLIKGNSELKLEETSFPAKSQYCLSCHEGIQPMRQHNSQMMQQIYELGAKVGDPNGCVVCHGGTSKETKNKDIAHSGAPKGNALDFYTPVPGALQVNDKTCGLCHEDHTYNAHRSIMNSDAGKMKAILWSWGIGTENYDHIYGDHNINDPDGTTPRFGSDTYKQYMLDMAKNHPGQFPTELKKIPEANLDSLIGKPEQVAFNYLRACNACHLSNKGYQDRGHFRGMGCSACHILYSNEGYYEGNDKEINKEKPGHLLVHSIQGTRKSKVKVNKKEFSGIQNSTCAACHAAGRRIGHAYQGLMAFDHRSPYDKEGNLQQANAGYIFKYIRDDAHHKINEDGKVKGGMLCQDCHTTNSMHGNGNIGTTTLATIEIECADCHGTPEKSPWELPIGYGDEFGKKLDNEKARGLATKPMRVTEDFATVYDKKDGYLLSARGNALGNVVKDGGKVFVHSATGKNFEVPVLKQIKIDQTWTNSKEARTAMAMIPAHMEKLECYACHSTWAAQYYGYQYKMDFSKKQQSIDWLDSPEKVYPDGTTAGYNKKYEMVPGVAPGDYSHVRWEKPVLGINGEGRVTPLVGVIQTVGSIVDTGGKVILHNHVAKTAKGIRAMELAPLNPHTTSKKARACKDCHGSDQAIGYGVDGGAYDSIPEITKYADAISSDGELLSKHTKVQIAAIKGLHGDFMQIINKKGEQMMTVDSHWEASMPLTTEQRVKLERTGTCTACHQDIPDGSIPMAMLGEIAKIVDLSYTDNTAHAKLLRENNIIVAWIKAVAIIFGLLFVPLLIIYFFNRKKIKKFIKKE